MFLHKLHHIFCMESLLINVSHTIAWKELCCGVVASCMFKGLYFCQQSKPCDDIWSVAGLSGNNLFMIIFAPVGPKIDMYAKFMVIIGLGNGPVPKLALDHYLNQ